MVRSAAPSIAAAPSRCTTRLTGTQAPRDGIRSLSGKPCCASSSWALIPMLPTRTGRAPLHRAVRDRCAAAVNALLEAGADPHGGNGRRIDGLAAGAVDDRPIRKRVGSGQRPTGGDRAVAASVWPRVISWAGLALTRPPSPCRCQHTHIVGRHHRLERDLRVEGHEERLRGRWNITRFLHVEEDQAVRIPSSEVK